MSWMLSKVESNYGTDMMEAPLRNNLCYLNRMFDIGVYTVLTSLDPLRVYVFESEVLLR